MRNMASAADGLVEGMEGIVYLGSGLSCNYQEKAKCRCTINRRDPLKARI